jgi:hypothetical protein
MDAISELVVADYRVAKDVATAGNVATTRDVANHVANGVANRAVSNVAKDVAKDVANKMNRKPMRKRSVKRQEFMSEDRIPRIVAIKKSGVGCLVCPLLDDEMIETKCAGAIQGLHERRKRSAGGSLENPKNLIPSCNWGNAYIENNPAQVRELFGSILVVREGDVEWNELSIRNDR